MAPNSVTMTATYSDGMASYTTFSNPVVQLYQDVAGHARAAYIGTVFAAERFEAWPNANSQRELYARGAIAPDLRIQVFATHAVDQL